MSTILRNVAMIIIVGFLGTAAIGQVAVPATPIEPAALAPADAGLLIQFNRMDQWLAEWRSDELVAFLKQEMQHRHDQSGKWQAIQTALGMTEDQVMDNFFGQTVALVGERPGKRQPHMLVSKVDPAMAALAAEKLAWIRQQTLGDFDLYNSPDGKSAIAAGAGWMLGGKVDYTPLLLSMLDPQGDKLADDATFKTWVGKMPADPDALFYSRQDDRGKIQSAAVQKTTSYTRLYYATASPKAEKLVAKLGNAPATSFGPLPAQTLATLSLNIIDRNPPNTRFLDGLVAPKSYINDVLPKLDAPTILFLGELKDNDFSEKPGFDVPVLGIAIKMNDATVAADLDRILNGMLLFANIATTRWETDPIAIRQVGAGPGGYSVANIGVALSQKAKFDELKYVQLVFGAIDDWYVITTHEKFYEMCLAQDPGRGDGFAQLPEVKAMGLRDIKSPIATAAVRTQALSRHLQSWIDFGRVKWPDVYAAAEQPGRPADKRARCAKGLLLMTRVLSFYDAMYLQSQATGANEVAATWHMVRSK